MNVLLIILCIALFICAVLIGATRSPKAKGIIDAGRAKQLVIYAVVIVALIIIVGLIKSNIL